MSVGPDYRTDLAIKHASQGDLFRRRFGVKIDENDGGVLAEALDFSQGHVKWVLEGGKERAALLIDDTNVRSTVDGDEGASLPGRSGWII